MAAPPTGPAFDKPKEVAKLRRRALSIAEKIEIVQAVCQNPSLKRKEIAKRFAIPQSTLNCIIANSGNLLTKSRTVSGKCKKTKSGKYERIEDAVLIWFKQAKAANLPINGPILKAKAAEIAIRLNIPFKASNGWIDRFRKRTGLVYKGDSRKTKVMNLEEDKEWQSTLLPLLLKGYEARDIFNIDECRLFFNLLPDKTLSFKGTANDAGKRSHERFTLLVGANMNGSIKLPLLIVGKPSKPRCFKNIKNLPCIYKSDENAWMNASIFKEYLQTVNEKMSEEDRKIILFLDNSAEHPKDIPALSNINLQFIPANSGAVLQPMDEGGVIQLLKQRFRKSLVMSLSEELHCEDLKQKKISILQAMNHICEAWDSLRPKEIAQCFQKCGFVPRSELETGESDENQDVDIKEEENHAEVLESAWNDLQQKMNFSCSFEDYVAVDEDVYACEQLCIPEITEHKQQPAEPVEPVDNGARRDAEFESARLSSSQAFGALKSVRRYIDALKVVPDNIYRNLWELEEFIKYTDHQIAQQAMQYQLVLENFHSNNHN